MQILVANLGSTSFKFRLLDMEQNGQEIARGAYERIGQAEKPTRKPGMGTNGSNTTVLPAMA